MDLQDKSMPEKPLLDVTATASTPLSGPEISAAMDTLIARGHPLESLTQRQVWRELGNRGSLETVSKWFKRYETKTATSSPEKKEGGKLESIQRSDEAFGDGPSAGAEGGTKIGTPSTRTPGDDENKNEEAAHEKTADSQHQDIDGLPRIPGAVLSLMQINFTRDITTLKESHQRECELLRQQTEDRVARTRAEMKADVITSVERTRRYAMVTALGLCVVVGGAMAWVGFTVGRAEGGKESQKAVGEWMEIERARAPIAPTIAPALPLVPEVIPASAVPPVPLAPVSVSPEPAENSAKKEGAKP